VASTKPEPAASPEEAVAAADADGAT